MKRLTLGALLIAGLFLGACSDDDNGNNNNVTCQDQDGDQYVFMDNSTYDQVFIAKEYLGDALNFMYPNIELSVLYFNGQPIGVELPNTVELTVSETEPGVKGDTATGATKPATLETGYVVQVPLFVNQGDRLRIDTRTGEYLERA